MRALTVVSLAVATLTASAVGAAARPETPPIVGRHDVLRAEMYARVLDSEGSPIQILDRLCPHPGRRTGCEPVPAALRTAIQKAVSVPIRWVGRERRRGGTFWQLGPVVRNGSRAHFDERWDDPAPYGCGGGGTLSFRRIDWTSWRQTREEGFVGCPVVALIMLLAVQLHAITRAVAAKLAPAEPGAMMFAPPSPAAIRPAVVAS